MSSWCVTTKAAMNAKYIITGTIQFMRKPFFPPLTGTVPQHDWDRLLMRMLEQPELTGRLAPLRFRSWRISVPTSRVRH